MRKGYRIASEIHRKKGAEYKERLHGATKNYLDTACEISRKIKQTYLNGAGLVADGGVSVKVFAILAALQYYHQMLDKHIDLVDRRILQGEKIPHEEKLFSIFETHTEWISKGKLHPKVELGLGVIIATDQYEFILEHQVMEKQVDVELALPVGEEIVKRFGGPAYELDSISFDRNFFSGPVKKALSKHFQRVIMPKPGKKSARQEEEENTYTGYQVC